jgi:hypothetical protein
MAPHPDPTPELRRFLVINFRVGTRENGYLVGPALVSTRNYRRFHYWDEPSAVVLGEDDFEVVKVYPLGLTCGEVSLLFAKDFPPTATGPYRSAGWIAPEGTFYSAEGWADLGQHPVLAA